MKQAKSIQNSDNKSNIIVQIETAQLNEAIVQAMPAQLEENDNFPEILRLISWTSHVEILLLCKFPEERLFYSQIRTRTNTKRSIAAKFD